MTDRTVIARGKLPVFDLVGQAYRTVFENLGALLQMAWFPLAILAVGHFVAIMLIGQTLIDTPAGETPPVSPLLAATQLGLAVIDMVIGASIAVVWHRFVLLGEKAQGGAHVRLDGRVWSYLGYGLLMGLGFVVAVAIPVGLLAIIMTVMGNSLTGQNAALLAPVALFMFLAGLFVLIRLSPFFPAKALGHSITMSDVWAKTDGNFWRLFGGGLLTALPPGLAVGIAASIASALALFSGVFALAIVEAIFGPLQALVAVFGVGFLSLAYRHFYAPGQ
jgi:hypothetical protein